MKGHAVPGQREDVLPRKLVAPACTLDEFSDLFGTERSGFEECRDHVSLSALPDPVVNVSTPCRRLLLFGRKAPVSSQSPPWASWSDGDYRSARPESQFRVSPFERSHSLRWQDPVLPNASEICVKREHVLDLELVHQHEGRTIRQRERVVSMWSKQPPRGSFRIAVNPL